LARQIMRKLIVCFLVEFCEEEGAKIARWNQLPKSGFRLGRVV